jgi:FlaA1/EpsC-like NDP-sugar epimerase
MTEKRADFRIKRNYLVIVHDLVMAAASFLAALILRRGFYDFQTETITTTLWGLALFTGVCALVFLRLRVYRGVWRYASVIDLIQVTKAVSLAILIFLPLLFIITRLETFPRSALVINWFILLALMGGARFAYRLARYRNLGGAFDAAARSARIPVLLAGAGDGAEAFIREMARNPAANYRVLGLFDDDRHKVGRDIHGLRVFGRLAELSEVVAKLKRRGERAQRLIVTDDQITGEPLARLLEKAEELGLTLARLPKLTDFRHGEAPIEARPVAIADLLGRPQAALDRAGMRALIEGKRVLITGAGGSIGGELSRQAAGYAPERLILLDNAEHALYQIDMEIATSHPELARETILGDVRDRARLDQVLARERPELVFHAAAFKHVPMVEANPNEGVLTNIVGTRNVAEACRDGGVGAMVLISTDKAVNPSSVMGATKRIAELYCHALDAGRDADGCHFVTVRFGNVLGSTGSVVPLFQRQLAAGGPITVTDPEVTRYFMTIREAVELVLQASVLGVHEPSGGKGVYVLDMGEPVLIADLARQLIRLAGLKPEIDIAIDYVGLRPGEKLAEELFHDGEPRLPTAQPGLMCAATRPAEFTLLTDTIDRLEAAARTRRTTEALALLRVLVPEYVTPAPQTNDRLEATP